MKLLFNLNYFLLSSLYLGIFLVSSPLKAQTTTDQDEYITGDRFQESEGDRSYFSKWSNGPSTDNSYFPIGVWYQSPSSVYKYSRLGINYFLYGNYGLNWEPIKTFDMTFIPTTESMSSYLNPPAPYANIINSWIYKDEPDLVPGGSTEPIPTATVIADYNTAVMKDPTRPIFLNVSYCVALDYCAGRASRAALPGDYYKYAEGADWLSLDIYPMNTMPNPLATGNEKIYLDIVAEKISSIGIAVDRLRKYGRYKKPVTAILECTNFERNPNCKLTPSYIKPEAWIAIIHGARGIAYFSHIANPMVEAGLLQDAEMCAAVTTNNALIRANASMINSPTVVNATTVKSGNQAIIVQQMTKRQNGYTYIYTVAEQPGSTNATFTLRGFAGESVVEVVGENRTLRANNGIFSDNFSDYDVHIYRVATPGKVQTALHLASINDADFKVYKESNSSTLRYECIDPVQTLEIYDLKGSKIQSMTNTELQGSIELDNQYKGTILIIKASTKNNTYVRKSVLN